jgi:hypothetical protein
MEGGQSDKNALFNFQQIILGLRWWLMKVLSIGEGPCFKTFL